MRDARGDAKSFLEVISSKINKIDTCLDSKLSETIRPVFLTYMGDCRYPLGGPGSLLPSPTWGTTDILLGCLVLYWYTCLLLCTPSPLTSIKACGFLPSAHCLVHRGNSASSWPPDAPQFPPPASPLVLPPLGWVRSARSCCLTLHTYHRVIIQMYNYWSIA